MEVHVINLDRDTGRMRTFLNRNSRAREIVRVAAVDGSSVDRQSLCALGTISEGLRYSDRELGCALSHIKLWRRAAKDGHALTIAEDDAVFARNFDAARDDVSRRLPEDWDLVLWGWNFDAVLQIEVIEGVASSILRSDQDALRRNIGIFSESDIAALPFRLRHAFGLLCYSISPGGAKALLDACLPLVDVDIGFGDGRAAIHGRSIDSAMNAVFASLKAYVCIPPLAVSENRRETSPMRPDT